MAQSTLVLLALLTGAMISFQLAFNGQLGQALSSTYLGAFFVFLVELVTLAALLVMMRETGRPCRTWPPCPGPPGSAG